MPTVERCEVCNFRLPRVQREDTRYCGSTCRVRASRARRNNRPNADLKRRFAWSRTRVDTRSWVMLWYRRLAHRPLRALAEQRKENGALRTQLVEARETIQCQADELAKLRAQLAALAEQSEIEAMASREVHAERNAAEERARSTAAELDETRVLVKRRGAELEEANHTLHDAQQRTTALVRELAAVREQSSAQSNRVLTLELQLGSLAQAKRRTEAQLAALEMRIGESARRLDREMDEARTARAERDMAQVQVLNLEAELDRAKWLVVIRSSESEEMQCEWNAAEHRIANLRRKLAQVHATSAQRKRRAAALGVKLAKTKQVAEQRQSQHEKQLVEVNERLAEQARTMHAVSDAAQMQTQDLASRLELLRRYALQIVQEKTAVASELGKARASNQELSTSIDEARQNFEKAQGELESYKAAIEKELAELRAHRDRTKEPTAELRAAKDEITRLRGDVISAEIKRDEAKRVLEIKRTLFGDRERSLETQLLQLKEQIRTLTAERDQAQEQLSPAKAKLTPTRGR